MSTGYKCLHCTGFLKAVIYHGKNWYRCLKCTSTLVPLQAFKQVLAQYEFNKLQNEFKFQKIKSLLSCPICKSNMGKVLDLVKINDVEICSKCHLVWLGPGEGEKIRSDQADILQAEKKVNLNSREKYEVHFCLDFLRPLARTNPIVAALLSVFIVGTATGLVLFFLATYLKRSS